MHLASLISPKRAPEATGEAEAREIEGAGADYQSALAALQGEVPEGWLLLGIRTRA